MLSEFSDYLCDLVHSSDILTSMEMQKLLNNTFNLSLDSIDFAQNVKESTHHFNHTLELVLTYGIETENLIVLPEKTLLSDRLSFKFKIMEITVVANMFHHNTCLSESDVTKFSDIIHTLLTSSILCTNTAQSSYLISTPTEVNYLVNNVKTILCMTMNTLSSLLEKASNQNYLPPWCNFQIYTLKQITRKLERRGNGISLI